MLGFGVAVGFGGQAPRTTSSVSSSFAAEPSIDAVTPIGASGEAHATCVVVSKQSCLGSAFQATRMRGGTESAQAGSPEVLIALADTLIAGWAFGSMPLRSSLLPAMSLVASSAPLAASRTVTVTAASSPGALSASATACHVAAPTVLSQRWSRRSIVRLSGRLEHGDDPFGSTVNTRPGSPRPTTQEPSNAAP